MIQESGIMKITKDKLDFIFLFPATFTHLLSSRCYFSLMGYYDILAFELIVISIFGDCQELMVYEIVIT